MWSRVIIYLTVQSKQLLPQRNFQIQKYVLRNFDIDIVLPPKHGDVVSCIKKLCLFIAVQGIDLIIFNTELILRNGAAMSIYVKYGQTLRLKLSLLELRCY